MPKNIIESYKMSAHLRFSDEELNKKFTEYVATRGKSSSVYGFLTLAILSFGFAYIEYFALAIDNFLPMILFIATACIAVMNLLISHFKTPAPYIRIRIVVNMLMLLMAVLYSVAMIRYRPSYAMEIILIIMWFSLFSGLKLRVSIFSNLLIIGSFVGAMQWANISISKVILVTFLLFLAALIGFFMAYIWERMRRTLFMTNAVMEDISARQEVWAYTLIDLDMALSGIKDFKQLLGRIIEFLDTVIQFESSVVTSLEGQGPKPTPLKVQGELFENEDKTIWGENLLSKLEQTRQSFNSNYYEEKKGFLGKMVKEFKHFRLDVPVFNEFNLVGVISLRRVNAPFDDLDMTASLSLVSQAMLIFNRSTHTQDNSFNPNSTAKVIAASKQETTNPKVYSGDETDIDLDEKVNKKPETLDSEVNESVAPKAIQEAFKQKDAAAKQSLVILSRENADKVSVDCYRTAAIDGESLSFLIIEIDGLSAIREKDGDKVAYRVFSGIAKQLFNKIDKDKHIVGRYGKNGISVLMPGVDMNAAEKFAESFRQFVEAEKYKTVYGTRTATLSIGIAAITDDTGDYPSMMKRADMALFVAKKNGRNCVKVRL